MYTSQTTPGQHDVLEEPEDRHAPDPYPDEVLGNPQENEVRPLTDSDIEALIQTLDNLYELEGEIPDHFLAKQSLPRKEHQNKPAVLDLEAAPKIEESWEMLEWTMQNHLGGSPTTDHQLAFTGVNTPRFCAHNIRENVCITVEMVYNTHISIRAGYRFFSNSDVWFELHDGTPTQWANSPATEQLSAFLDQINATLRDTHDYQEIATDAYLEAFCPRITEVVTDDYPKHGTSSFAGLNALQQLVTDGATADEWVLEERDDTFSMEEL